MRHSRMSLIWLVALTVISLLASAWPASAQPPLLAPTRVLHYTTASVSINNSVNSRVLYSYLIPGAFVATQAMSNTAEASIGMANASAPLHLSLTGLVSLGSGTLNCGISYGKGNAGVATVSLPNAMTAAPAMVSVPVSIDVWIMPIATGTDTTATPNQTNSMLLSARFATALNQNAAAFGTMRLASANEINVICNTGTAGTGNGIQIHRALLRSGG